MPCIRAAMAAFRWDRKTRGGEARPARGGGAIQESSRIHSRGALVIIVLADFTRKEVQEDGQLCAPSDFPKIRFHFFVFHSTLFIQLALSKIIDRSIILGVRVRPGVTVLGRAISYFFLLLRCLVGHFYLEGKFNRQTRLLSWVSLASSVLA